MALRFIRALALGTLLSLLFALVVGAAPAAPSPLRSSLPATSQSSLPSSPIWSGYVVEGSKFMSITGKWEVPQVKASKTATYSSAWIGIDGYGQKPLIQIGTESKYVNGSPDYYAWWQILPTYSQEQVCQDVAPGDVMTAAITKSSGSSWTMQLVDTRDGSSFTVCPEMTETYTGPGTSAEWIVERDTVDNKVTTLANYGEVTFDYATLNGANPKLAATERLVMASGGATLSNPSAPDSDHDGFTVAYGKTKPPARVSTIAEFTIPTSDSSPQGITTGPDGNLWFTEYGSNKIGRMTQAGAFKEFLIPVTGDSYPEGITAGPDGNLWFTESGPGQIGRITTTGTITQFSLPASGSSPQGITKGPDGNLWFTEFNTNAIGRITTTGAITEFPTPTTGSNPESITTGSDGNLWFTESAANKIGRITPSCTITEFTIPTSSSEPWGITKGPDGNLWFTEEYGNNIGRITTAGTITEFPILTQSSYPKGIAAGPGNTVWFTEASKSQVALMATKGAVGAVTEFLSGPSGFPAFITTGPDGYLWFTEAGSNKIGHAEPRS